MNTEERIRRHLEASTSGLKKPDRLDYVMAEGRRRKVRARTATVLGAAAVLAAVVTVGSALTGGSGSPSVATTPSTPSAPATTAPVTEPTTAPVAGGEPLGVVVADMGGITILDIDGAVTTELASPDPYREVAVAYPDGTGGLIYQHATTPLPWEQGTVLRLAAGTTEPGVLVSPPPGGTVIPVGTGTSGEDNLFYYLQEAGSAPDSTAAVMAVDLAEGPTRQVMDLPQGSDVTAGGSVVAVVDRAENSCPTVHFVDVDGTEIPSPLSEDCLPAAAGVSVSADGTSAAILAGGDLQVVRIADGTELMRHQITDAYMATAGAGGWAVRTPDQTILVGPSGQSTLPPVEAGTVVPYARPFEVDAAASLGGGGSEETAMPCVPTQAGLPPQDLPGPVAETRQRLFDLAADCDYQALADIATTDGTSLTFGAEADPVELWVRDGRQGDEPLARLAGLLQTTPAEDPDAGIWAWPAVHVDPSNESSWAELEPILGSDTVELLRDAPDGYLGPRVGIGADGRWFFYVAGD